MGKQTYKVCLRCKTTDDLIEHQKRLGGDGFLFMCRTCKSKIVPAKKFQFKVLKTTSEAEWDERSKLALSKILNATEGIRYGA